MVVVFAAAALLAVVFALRLVVSGLRPPPDPPLQGWMTPRLVAHGWHLPPDLLADALDLPRDGTGRRDTLDDLARARGVPVDALIGQIEAAIAAHRAGQ